MIKHQLEVKKDGLRQTQDGTWKISLTVHPNDMDVDLMSAPMGTRYMAVLVPIGDDEQPVSENGDRPVKRRFGELPLSQQAALACQNEAFRAWLGVGTEDADAAAEEVRQRCDVDSRRQFDLGGRGAANWTKLYALYQQATGRTAEAR